MSLLQIGELANHLPDDFIQAKSDIPWHEIIAMRNVVVHGYDILKHQQVWKTVVEDIPTLEGKCRSIMIY
jgi:uncharacterized protein with HEPN domain